MTREGAGRHAPAPSSPAGSGPRAGSGTRAVSVREWASDIRFSGFVGIMLGLVILAAFVLVPTVSTYLGQRQQIAALEESVRLTEQQVADLEAARERWADPAYVTAQARERLYYFKPGEVVYLVDDDLPDTAIAPEQQPVSDDVQEARTDWMGQMLRSVTAAGLARTASAGG